MKKGFVPNDENGAVDVAIVSPDDGLHARGCEWLVFAAYRGVPVAWADGADPRPIVGPPGYEVGRTTESITPTEASDRLVYLRTENSIDIYFDKLNKEEVYVGRAYKE